MWRDRIHDMAGGPRAQRRALMLALASAGLFIVMTVLWLSVSTRAAILNQQLDALEARRDALEREIAELQEQIGDATSATVIEQRMRAAGFESPEAVRFLLVPTPLPIPATVTTTAPPGMATGGDR